MKIAINGVLGRMGRTVERLAGEAGLEIAFRIDAAAGDGVVKSLPSKVDALIDFSLPAGSMERLDDCLKTSTPVVICTTGFTDAQKAKITEASKKIPVLLASNTSVGVNLLFKILPEVARTLGPSYDIDVVETHHRTKKDAPSGTAKTMAERIEAATGRAPTMHAMRQGDVVGEHTVVFGTAGDTIEITHRARSRDIFGRGALDAAKWISTAKPGLYSMLDVLS